MLACAGLAVVRRDRASESVYSEWLSSRRLRGATLTEPVTVERDGHVLLIGVNRPAKRNAFNLAAIDALGRAYEILGTDDELRAGVLFAHGDHFSAGLDLAEVGPAVAGHGPQVLRGSHRFDPFGVWGDPVPKPVDKTKPPRGRSGRSWGCRYSYGFREKQRRINIRAEGFRLRETALRI